MSLTDRDRKIVLALVPVLVLAAYWFLLLAPKREEAAKAGHELGRAGAARASAARTQLDAGQARQTDFAADYGEIVRLGKAVPASVDMPSLIVQLDAAAEGTGIRFTKIATGERTRRPRRRTAPPRRPRAATPRPGDDPRGGGWRAGAERARRGGRVGQQRRGHLRPAQRRGRAVRRGPATPRPPPPRPGPARRRRHPAAGATGAGGARLRGRSRDRAARARVHRRLLRPGRLLPRREALRARGRHQRGASAAA